MMRDYKVKLKDGGEMLSIHAHDVDLQGDDASHECDYNFLSEPVGKDGDHISIARIPFREVAYITS